MTENGTKLRIPATGDPATRAARVLSDLFAPAVSVFLMCVLCGAAGTSWTAPGLLWGLVTGIFCAVIPMSVIHLAVRRKRLTDRHVTRRDQRWWVFLVCVGSVLCGMTAAALLGAPHTLLWILPTMVAGLVLAGGVTLLGPKVSMHAFCFTSLVILAALLLSPWWLLALPVLLPLVAFARLKLKHHTRLELALGSGLAAVVMLGASAFMPAAG
ncbi:hypothetical protein ACFVVC_02150 [Pseudarthrobacter sp. NPDC058196]|uniref:hypothetical protein n=1 Tax=Pseudarthrobacter sp. NPDC058196 TaxID=3346376 RepID=UPI0036DF26B9